MCSWDCKAWGWGTGLHFGLDFSPRVSTPSKAVLASALDAAVLFRADIEDTLQVMTRAKP